MVESREKLLKMKKADLLKLAAKRGVGVKEYWGVPAIVDSIITSEQGMPKKSLAKDFQERWKRIESETPRMGDKLKPLSEKDEEQRLRRELEEETKRMESEFSRELEDLGIKIKRRGATPRGGQKPTQLSQPPLPFQAQKQPLKKAKGFGGMGQIFQRSTPSFDPGKMQTDIEKEARDLQQIIDAQISKEKKSIGPKDSKKSAAIKRLSFETKRLDSLLKKLGPSPKPKEQPEVTAKGKPTIEPTQFGDKRSFFKKAPPTPSALKDIDRELEKLTRKLQKAERPASAQEPAVLKDVDGELEKLTQKLKQQETGSQKEPAILDDIDQELSKLTIKLGAKRDVARVEPPPGKKVGLVNGLRVGMVNGTLPKTTIDDRRTMEEQPSSIAGITKGMINGTSPLTSPPRSKKQRGFPFSHINGNGLTNGNGLSNGHSIASIPDHGRAASDIGFTNGNGLTNGGVTQGSLLWRLQGTLGLKKTTRIQVIRSRLARERITTAMVIILLFLIPSLVYTIGLETTEEIVIDGQFQDWADVTSYSDSFGDTSRAQVDIIEYRMTDLGEKLSIYVEVEEEIMGGVPVDSISYDEDTGTSQRSSTENFPQYGLDLIWVFFDSDDDPSTGYLVDGLGANHLIEISGFQGVARNSKLMSYDGDDAHDWNGWTLSNTVPVRVDENRLEAQVGLYTVLGDRKSDVTAVIHTRDVLGNEDTSDAPIRLKASPGLVNIEEVVTAPPLVPSGAQDVQFLTLNVSISNGGSLEQLGFELQGSGLPYLDKITISSDSDEDALISDSDMLLGVLEGPFSPGPVTFSIPDEVTSRTTILVSVDTLVDPPVGSTLGLRMHRSTTRGLGIFAIHSNIPLGTDFVSSYLGDVPQTIFIDGAFADWSRVLPFKDSDASPLANPDVDMQEYRIEEDHGNISFMFSVKGEMLGGSAIPTDSKFTSLFREPSQPDRDADGVPDVIDAHPDQANDSDSDGLSDDFELIISGTNHTNPDTDGDHVLDGQDPDPLNVNITGEEALPRELLGPWNADTAIIYFDLDDDRNTGYTTALLPLGADAMLRITGKYGFIMERSLYFYEEEGQNRSWTKVIDVPCAADSYRLETQIDQKVLGSEDLEVPVFFYISDWSDRNIDTSDRVVSLTGGGFEDQRSINVLNPTSESNGRFWTIHFQTTGSGVLFINSSFIPDNLTFQGLYYLDPSSHLYNLVDIVQGDDNISAPWLYELGKVILEPKVPGPLSVHLQFGNSDMAMLTPPPSGSRFSDEDLSMMMDDDWSFSVEPTSDPQEGSVASVTKNEYRVAWTFTSMGLDKGDTRLTFNISDGSSDVERLEDGVSVHSSELYDNFPDATLQIDLYDIYPDSHLEYTLHRSGLKEELILENVPELISVAHGNMVKDGWLSVDMELLTSSGLDVIPTGIWEGSSISTATGLTLADGGETIFLLGEPMAWDSDGNLTMCRYIYDPLTSTLSIQTDAQWLQKATYPVTIDPTVITNPGSGGNIGTDIAVGDFNNDGYDDMASNQGNTVVIYYGSALGLSSTVGTTIPTPPGAFRFPECLETGDIDGDGYDDLVVGSYGNVYVYYGGPGGISTTPGATISPPGASLFFGSSVAVGDMDGDGFDDIAVGDPMNQQVSVFDGDTRTSFNTGVDLVISAPDGGSNQRFGSSLAFGNFNGDTNGTNPIEDLLIGDPFYFQSSGPGTSFGAVYQYNGSANTPDNIVDMRYYNPMGTSFNRFGHSLGGADMDGDGSDEVYVGAPNYNGNMGTIYRFWGNNNVSQLLPNTGSPGSFGWDFDSGDVNGDGYDDILVGSPNYNNGSAGDGRAYLFTGSPSSVVFNQFPNNTFTAPGGTSERMGFSVALGDFDNDGLDDGAIGSPNFMPAATADGRVWVYNAIELIPEFSSMLAPMLVLMIFIFMLSRKKSRSRIAHNKGILCGPP